MWNTSNTRFDDKILTISEIAFIHSSSLVFGLNILNLKKFKSLEVSRGLQRFKIFERQIEDAKSNDRRKRFKARKDTHLLTRLYFLVYSVSFANEKRKH